MRSFLGMVNYHGKFIRNLNSILQTLNQLLQKNQEFTWSPKCEEAFTKAKDSLTSSNVLVHYDPILPVVLENDASQYGIGAVILHRFPNGDEKPIAYASRSLNSAEKNYSQIEKEGLAIIFGVTKYYMYLFGRKFTSNWPQVPAEDFCTRIHNTSVGSCSSPVMVASALVLPVSNWVEVICWGSQCRRLIQASAQVQGGCKCRREHISCGQLAAEQAPSLCSRNC